MRRADGGGEDVDALVDAACADGLRAEDAAGLAGSKRSLRLMGLAPG